MENRIAVIGMAARFPDAGNLTAFYRNLRQAACSIRELSAERIRRTTLEPGAAYQRRGYMENIDEFDHEFFNIPYAEAIHMDPHQRLLLEVVAEAIANTGYSLDDVYDTNTAVFAANRNLQYYQHADQFDPMLVTGNASEFLAARINRVFNLTGSVSVIDTSCSSGLVALHHACNELRLGHAKQALVCGVNLELFPYKHGQYHIEVDSPDGFSIPFTAASNGMVYGEAVICVVLKPLEAALLDRDNILAVVTGSAVNNNAARAASLTAPDSIAQADVLQKAWSNAGVTPDMLAFIEAHGSATQLGDSLEVAGFNIAIEAYTGNEARIPISTVKSNIGHTRSVAGLAGFVKAVLSIQNKTLLPSVYQDPPNAQLQLGNARVYVQQSMAAWDIATQGTMRAGVSSIGFSGTNCHVVIEQAHKPLNGIHHPDSLQHGLFLFSSWKEQLLPAYIGRYEQLLKEEAPHFIDLSYTLGKGRNHYPYRKAFVAGDLQELKLRIADFVHGHSQVAPPAAPPRLLYIFSPGELLSYGMIDLCATQSRYFNERYSKYLESVSTGMERTAPQLFRTIFQLAYYDLLLHNGVATDSLLGIGTGQLITRVIRKELSLDEALRKMYESAAAPQDETGLAARVDRLLQSHAGGQPVIFIDMALGSSIYPILARHPQHGRSFFLHQLPAASPVHDIPHLQAFLYEHHYATPARFFDQVPGHRIALPAHPFANTRCWIREQPKKKDASASATAASHQPAEPPARPGTLHRFIMAAWREALGLESSAPVRHFFEDGGDSLRATKVIQQINKQFSIRLDFEDLFDYPALDAFTELVSARLGDEQQLMLIWKDVLGYESLNTTDNFFEKGGHSLLANQVLNRMKAEMNVRVDFEDFFAHPTVASMIAFLGERKQAADDDRIPVAPEAESYPVSHLQRRLWILSQLEAGSVAYNEFNAYNLQGNVDVDALKRAIETIVRRHDSFRTIFADGREGPRQVILPYGPAFGLQYEALPPGISQEELTAIVKSFAKTPFVLSEGPLVRMKLLRIGNDRHVFLFNIHHILFDEWSNQVFIRELMHLYTAYSNGRQAALPPLRIQYKDYACWLSDPQRQHHAKDEDYWLPLLRGGVPVLDLPTDLPRPPMKTFNGSSVTKIFPVGIKQSLAAISARGGTSMFMTLTALTALLMHRYARQHTIIFGTPVAGRKDMDMESGIGFYANTVLLKLDIDPAQSFLQLLAGAKQAVTGAFTHQLYPFDLLVEKLDAKTDRSRMPLFDVMIGYQKNAGRANTSFQMNDITLTAFGQPRETSKFDLSLDFMEDAESIALSITYNTDLFLPARMSQLFGDFALLADRIAADVAMLQREAAGNESLPAANEEVYQTPSGRVQAGEIMNAVWQHEGIGTAVLLPAGYDADGITLALTPARRPAHQQANAVLPGELPQHTSRPATAEDLAMLAQFNATERTFPPGTVCDHIRHWAAQTPQATAVSCMNKCLTYAELNDATDRLAQQLLLKGVHCETVVPVLAERSIELVLAFIAILKCGAAYLPLSTDAPANRIADITADCGAPFVLAAADITEMLAMPPAALQTLPGIHGGMLAYVIYTSGSTGRPKGVMIEHAGMMNHIHGKIELLGMTAQTKVVQNAPQSFDISIWQMLSALVTGGHTIIYPTELVEHPREFADALVAGNPHVLEVVPSYLDALLDVLSSGGSYHAWTPQYVLVTGEAFAPHLAARWFRTYPNVPLVNAYGPTEASDDITHHVFSSVAKEQHRLPIGKPVPNMKIYIVDDSMQCCAIGSPGEICVSGAGVGRGYLGQPDKTKEVFIDNPWQPGTRMYKTGDLGYFTHEGVVEFLGRKDHQVKIHGHRIETAEIEHCLAALEGVQQAAVLSFKNSSDGNAFLAAYLLVPPTVHIGAEAVKAALRAQLPPYMIPSYIIGRNEFPLTPNGKIDRKAFADPSLFTRDAALESSVRRHLARLLPDYKIPRRIVAIGQLPSTQEGSPDWDLLRSIAATGDAIKSTPPQTPTEEALAAIWCELLGLQEIGIDDDFFEKGGQSLKGMRMLAAMEDRLGKRLGLRHLFATPTIRGLAAQLASQPLHQTNDIPVQSAQQHYPVSYAQRRMWVMDHLGNAGYAYNICGALQLGGKPDQAAWERSWMQLIRRHEVLRTNFYLHEGEIVQSVTPFREDPYRITYADVSHETDPARAVQEAYRRLEQTVFDLEKGPLLRSALLRTAPDAFVFVYVLHHIISDEWSLELLSKELLRCYAAEVAGHPATLEELAVQYRDYACWQRQEELHWERSRNYWHNKFRQPLPVLQLPVDNQRPAVKTYNGGTQLVVMEGMGEKLSALGAQHGATLFMLLLSAVKVFLHRYCGQDDLVVGTPVAGRTHPQLQNAAGLYLNTLALRTAVQPADKFQEVLQRVRQTVIEAFEHQDYPFDRLVEELGINKDLSRSALFDVMVVLHDEAAAGGQSGIHTAGLTVKPYGIASTASKFDLSFHFRKTGNDLEAGLNYNTDLFRDERASLALAHFTNLLSAIVKDISLSIEAYDYLTAAERSELLAREAWQPALPQSVSHGIIALAAQRADHCALRDEHESMTYARLRSLAGGMAEYLRHQQGVQPGQVIGLYMDRSVGMMISVLAILETGAAYLPLDKSFPEQRLAFMLEDSGAALVISEEAWSGPQPCVSWKEALRLSQHYTPAAEVPRTQDSIAYIIYTSGTSGKPKGVRITDGALLNYVAGITHAYGLHDKMLRGLLASSMAFDLGYTCCWGTLLNGGTLHLLPQATYWQPGEVMEWIARERISFIKLTPSHFRLLVSECRERPELRQAGEPLEWIILGGEKLSGADIGWWREQYPHCVIANHYGPTETTVGVLTHVIDNLQDFAAQPVLGKAMGGHAAYITDHRGALCGKGVWGELLVAGPGVSPGYLNRDDLNEQKFIGNPFAQHERAYRTGDRCRVLLDGSIEFAGRIDAQVQIKGYRVELPEIEQVLLQLDSIAHVAVTAAIVQGEEQLVAYAVPADGQTLPEAAAIRNHVSAQLPAYMVPWRVIAIDKLPLTGNGKTDRSLLPDPSHYDAEPAQAAKAPQTSAEEYLVKALAGLMKNREVSIDKNFFDLGGDSIKAIQLSSRLYGLGWKLEIREVFEHPALEQLATRMRPVHRVAHQGIVEGETPLGPIQHEFFARGFSFEHHYNQSVLLHYSGRLDAKLMVRVIRKVITHHDALRMVYRLQEGRIRQYNLPAIETELFDIDLSTVQDPVTELTHQSQQLQESFDLEQGPLFKAAIFRMQQDDRLLLVAHHLVMDGVSWRIVLEDVSTLYQQALRNEELQLPLKTDSFRAWTTALQELASGERFAATQSYWFNTQAEQQLLWPRGQAGVKKDTRLLGFELDSICTDLLLSSVQRVYHTEINDLFLAALSACMAELYGVSKVWIALEGHGREPVVDLDISRTVGWFTSVYPVCLPAQYSNDTEVHIISTKGKLRAIPQKGIGYGLVKYLSAGMAGVGSVQPEIVFNYLGQFDGNMEGEGFRFAQEHAGQSTHAEEKIMYPMAISARVSDYKLRVNAEFDPAVVPVQDQQRICAAFEKHLLHIIAHCTSKTGDSDADGFQYKGMTQETLESLFD